MSTLPPPPPVLWAPRFRRRLQRFLVRMDRRKARHLLAQSRSAAEVFWQREYAVWWDNHGWAQGAPTAEQALRDLRAHRP